MTSGTHRDSTSSAIRRRLALAATLLAGLPVIVGSWIVVYVWMLLATEAYLAPWDYYPGRPPIGAWDRTVNDFFETVPGSHFPAVSVVGASIALFVIAAWRRLDIAIPLFLFTVINLTFVVASVAVTIGLNQLVTWWLPFPVGAYDAGYHRTWPQVVLALVLVAGLLKLQAMVGRTA